MSLQKLLRDMEGLLKYESTAAGGQTGTAANSIHGGDRDELIKHLEASISEFRSECVAGGLFNRILVAVDDSKPAGWAVRLAGNLAALNGAKLAFVHVIHEEMALTPEFAMVRSDFEESHREAAMDLLHRAETLVPGDLCPELLLKIGDPAEQIVRTAKEWDADVVVIGTHGRGPVAHMLLGSTAESVVRHAHRPVLTAGRDPAEASTPNDSDASKAENRGDNRSLPRAGSAGRCSGSACGCKQKAAGKVVKASVS